MDHHQHTRDFASDEQAWASSLPHHPPGDGALQTSSTPRFPRQLSFPQEGPLPVISSAPTVPPLHVPAVFPPGGTAPPAFVSHSSHPDGLSRAQQHREYMKAKRRVPASQRKRTQVSCDACKTRRCKCIRLGAGTGSDDESGLPPCKLCTDTGIPCVTTMPRKQRVYGSVENLDKRYRALEALLTGFFPDLNPRASAEGLVAFGRRMGITMPEFTDTLDQTKITAAGPSGSSITSRSSTTSDHAHYLGLGMVKLEKNQSILQPPYFTRSAPMASRPMPLSQYVGGIDPGDGCSGLVSDTGGQQHYIGPSGSQAFLEDVRRLISGRIHSHESTQARTSRDPADRGEEGMVPKSVLNSLDSSMTKVGPGRFSSSQARRMSSGGGRNLEGDEPSLAREDSSPRMVEGLNYWHHRRPASMIELPPKDQADACVDAFFHHVHPNFILFHRSTFQRAYDTLYRSWEAARQGIPDEQVKEITVTSGWLICLYMIFVFGSRSQPQTPGSLEFQRKWHTEAENLPPHPYTASLPNVCGHMLLSLHYHHINDWMSAWMSHGVACRFAIALGLHRQNVSRSFDPIRQYLRQRVWWTLYSYEQFLCCSLGRPSAIDCRDMDVGIPDDDFLEGNILPPRYLEHAAVLYILIAAIRREIFDPARIASSMYRRAVDFLDPLASWQDNLPRRLKPTSAEDGLDGNEAVWRGIHMLHIRYHYTLCVLTRPFLLKVIQSANGGDKLGPDETLIVALGRIGLTGAMRAGELLVELWRADAINGVTWMDIFYVHLSSLCIILALMSPKTLEQDWDRDPGGQSAPQWSPLRGKTRRHVQSYSVEEMRDMVQLLCRIASSAEVCGTNARFAKLTLEFSKAMGVIDPDDPSFKSSPLPNARMMAEFLSTGTEGSGTASGPESRSRPRALGAELGERRAGPVSPGYQRIPYQKQQQSQFQQPQQQQQNPLYSGRDMSTGDEAGYPVWITGPNAPSFPTAGQNPPTDLGSGDLAMNLSGMTGSADQTQGEGQNLTASPALGIGTLAPANNPAGGNVVQWDMVMPSSHWDDDVVNMDLTWDWQVSPMDPYQQAPGYEGGQ